MKSNNKTEKWTYGYDESQYKRFTVNALKFLLLFSFLYCCIYCMRKNLDAGALYMTAQGSSLGWGEAEIGILTSVLFWTYGIGHLINGRLSERIGPPKFIIGAVLFSFAANMGMGLVGFLPIDKIGSNGMLAIMAVIWGLNGYFQSMAWTSGLAVLTNWWPSDRHGFAVGFANAFSGFGGAFASLSVVLSVAFSEKLGLDLGWQAVFFLPAVFPLVMLVVYLIFARTSPEQVGLPPYREQNVKNTENEDAMREIVRTKGVLFPYLHLFRNPRFVIFIFVVFFAGVARHGMTQWVPFYFSRTYGISVEASILGSLALPVGMGMGTLIVPLITDKLCPNNRMPAIIISALGAAASIFGFLFLDPTVPAQLVLIQILLFIAGFGIYAVNGTVFTYATDIGGRVFSATAAGILDCAAYMGAAIQALVYGFMFELHSTLVFYTIVIFCVANAALAFIGSRRRKTTADPA